MLETILKWTENAGFKINIINLYCIFYFIAAVQIWVVYFPPFFCMGYQIFPDFIRDAKHKNFETGWCTKFIPTLI
jgi:hypothetical protein